VSGGGPVGGSGPVGGTGPVGGPGPQRYASVIGLRPEHAQVYLDVHTAVWPKVLDRIAACGIRNYSIFRHGDLLFSYFEYHGGDFAADMAAMADDPHVQRWWKLVGPWQRQLGGTPDGEWWMPIPEVFHTG
jgi:L-rhamnose mutarotase